MDARNQAAVPPEVLLGPTGPDDAREADLAATWFARIGALAVLVGAGFGYKFAVDRGLIGPGARVALGVMTALALIAGGEWAARRGWSSFAQAVAGGGTGLLYLTGWAAFHQYGLISGPVAFGLLGVVAAVGTGLAIRHDSQALGILATVGAFANPVVVGAGAVGVGALYGYVVTVDLCVLALAYFRRWELLSWVAAGGSWALFLGYAFATTAPTAIAYASTFHVIFMAAAAITAVRAKERHIAENAAGFLVVNGAVYVAALVSVMTPTLSQWLGTALAVVGILYLALGYVLWKRRIALGFAYTALVMGGALGIVWVPVQFESVRFIASAQLRVRCIAAVWTAEGAVAIFAGYRARLERARLAGAILMTVAAGLSFVALADGGAYRSASLFVSAQSLTYVVQALGIFVGAVVLMRCGTNDERQAGVFFLGLGNLLTLVWMSLEASAYVNRAFPIDGRVQTVQFMLTAVWSLYACGLVIVGVVRKSRLARWLGVGLFAGTVLKLVLSDVWLLGTGYRTLVFVGVGVLLLTCSLLYSRFKELLLQRPAAPVE